MNKLNCGCGPCYMDGWVNLDISREHKTDVCGDVCQIHFDENIFDAIYGCHFYEHLSYPNDALECLIRFYKWLKPAGILRLSVPDLTTAVKAFYNGSDMKFIYGEEFKGYYHKDTPCERFNFFMKEWDHKIIYDFNLLSGLFEDAGFRNVQERGANDSDIPEFSHDRFISESLYIEATK